MSIAKKWFQQALEDLDTAEYCFDGGKYYAAGFWAQQAIEKALKAVWIAKGKGLKKTRELAFLAEEVGAPREVVADVAVVSPLEMKARYLDYEGETPKEAVDERRAHNAVLTARKVIEWCKTRI
ncbi:MAG: HEPN domain-containing protein [Candidatus Micrarchaeota archaeon]